MTNVLTEQQAAIVLAALVNNGRPVGLGILHAATSPPVMSVEEAGILLKRQAFDTDYVRGRPIKINFKRPLSLWLFDRDNGRGAGSRAIRAHLTHLPTDDVDKVTILAVLDEIDKEES
jgi:hypothetical protein